MKTSHLYIANWKMSFSLNEALSFVSKNYEALLALAKHAPNQIILCPSTEALYPLSQVLKDSNINLGAQDCSEHTRGAFTGQNSIVSLQQMGCSHVIIGHSERRTHNNETNDIITHKADKVLDHNMTPIFCVGETAEEYINGTTLEILNNQLQGLFDLAQKYQYHKPTICIAYEPVWAIGTGKVSSNDHIELVLSWIHEKTHKLAPFVKWKLIYGGSVSSENISTCKAIPLVDGFLMGRTSLSFQELEKIVHYT